MARGTPKGKIHTTFDELLKALREQALAQYEGVMGATVQPHDLPPNAITQRDIPQLHTGGFDRSAINENYADCLTDPQNFGTVGDVVSLKQQLDFVATAERAYRVRHMSPVRAAAHSAGRRRGVAKSAILTNMTDSVASFLTNSGAPQT